MKTLYHGTSILNVESIQEEGLKKSIFEGGVYLTDSADSAAAWTGFKLAAQGQQQLAVIEVKVDESKLEPGVDHSPLMQAMFGAGESLVHEGNIKADQITDILYYGKKE